MPTKPRKIPSYRLHRPTGQAVVRLDGHDHYLGKHGTEASQEAYRRKVAEWLTARPPDRDADVVPIAAAHHVSVNDLVLAFWTRHAVIHYRHADGTPTGEEHNFRDSLRPLRKLYGSTPAGKFGPLALKAIRQNMIDAGLARTTINQRIGRIIHVFKWAVENEMVPPNVHHGLKAVAGLQRGRSAARETGPVKPVPEAYVEAIRPHVARQIWAMIELQRLTGMRPGEVMLMRAGDLETSGKVWVYTPSSHKTAHLEQERKVYLGPRAQAVVRPWLRTDLTAFLFDPREAMEERRAERRRLRKTPLTPSQRSRRPKANPRRSPRDRYSTQSYHHAIRRACQKSGVPMWHPHQLRHNAATWLRKEFSLEVARIILGHGTLVTTDVYAELDREKALAVVERVG